MNRVLADKRSIFGLLLAGLGLILLIDNLHIMPRLGSLIWAFLFLGASAVFLGVYLSDRAQWWALFPTAALGSIAVLIAVGTLMPSRADWGGALFLGTLGAAFLFVYKEYPIHWWALIPGGTLVTLAAVTLSENIPLLNGGAIFFFGLSATFAAVYQLANQRWAIIPAAALLALALIITIAGAFKWLLPLALIGIGLYALLRNQRDGV